MNINVWLIGFSVDENDKRIYRTGRADSLRQSLVPSFKIYAAHPAVKYDLMTGMNGLAACRSNRRIITVSRIDSDIHLFSYIVEFAPDCRAKGLAGS